MLFYHDITGTKGPMARPKFSWINYGSERKDHFAMVNGFKIFAWDALKSRKSEIFVLDRYDALDNIKEVCKKAFPSKGNTFTDAFSDECDKLLNGRGAYSEWRNIDAHLLLLTLSIHETGGSFNPFEIKMETNDTSNTRYANILFADGLTSGVSGSGRHFLSGTLIYGSSEKPLGEFGANISSECLIRLNNIDYGLGPLHIPEGFWMIDTKSTRGVLNDTEYNSYRSRRDSVLDTRKITLTEEQIKECYHVLNPEVPEKLVIKRRCRPSLIIGAQHREWFYQHCYDDYRSLEQRSSSNLKLEKIARVTAQALFLLTGFDAEAAHSFGAVDSYPTYKTAVKPYEKKIFSAAFTSGSMDRTEMLKTLMSKE